MYLKSIEVQGFKSFANKILFEFHNGITGIVGPNGSGKSNVGDAVRWVLGEQSAKQLRGSNMQDVIFSGTENRKPLGYAFVAITLDNSDHQLPIDYEEVTVARKVYRSGESEYLINGSACRLKDVQELFYDTGIGKEGYSLIGQGQIDRILSGKPEERRELFDEAAGIVKFKKRKKATQKSLENERANLVRVNDILSELEKQVGPLEKQSEKAKIYLKKREELKELDVNKFLLEIVSLKEQMKELENKSGIVQEDLQGTQEQFEQTKRIYEELQNKSRQVEESIDEARTANNQASLTIQRLEGDINVLKEQIHSTADAEKRIEERRQAVVGELKEREKQHEDVAAEHQELKSKLDLMKRDNSDTSEQLQQVQQRIKDTNDRIENGKNSIIEMLNEKAATQGRQQRYDTMQEQVQIRRAELNQKILTMKSDENVQQTEIDKWEKELGDISEKLGKLSEKKDALQKQAEEWKQSGIQYAGKLQEQQTDYHKQQSRLESLINITERYDGYGNAIQRVMEQKEKYAGIIGVVADIIKVDKRYEVAIETALGGNIRNIVTDDEQTAKKMIEFLKRQHYGRATFLPLDSIQGRSGLIREEALLEEGSLGVADTLVEADGIYQNLLVYLLGRTLVVDTMDHAIAIARKYQHSLRIVTLEGELLNPGGSMTGGAFKNSSNLLGRRREIEELQEKIDVVQKKIEKLQQQMEDNDARIASNGEKQEKLSKQLQELYLSQNTAKLNYNQAKEKKQEFTKDYQNLRREGEEMESQLLSISAQKKQINEEVILIQNKIEELNGLIDEWQMSLLEEQKNEQALTAKLSQKQIDQAGLQQKQSNLKQNLDRLSDEIEKFKQEQEQLEEQKNEVLEESELKEEKISAMQQERQMAESEKKSSKERLDRLIEEREALAANNSEFLDKREKLMERKTDLDKELARLESQREKLDESYELSMNYMWEEYELTLNTALPMKNEAYTDASELKKQIKALRTQIHDLGNVNVNAIEEYKEVSERYEFLHGQQTDILEAEEALVQLIKELDEGMRRQFSEKFEQIRVEFDKVFKELFGGGKGTLQLDEDVDILEAGIRINSQPPGKKLGNMMQLSGGEKALTAIALLFAIQNLKPSPFCLLDEIEAALDDSNVTRYAKYLHKLTKHTQFIIITHRRGTMAAADRLYGITMQEKGVSTLVSVDLIESDLR